MGQPGAGRIVSVKNPVLSKTSDLKKDNTEVNLSELSSKLEKVS